jgi:DNA invertase Pin-like site-specific DNA recombinase
MTTTPAGIWLRVSDESQNEDNQISDLEAWCGAHGYAVAPEHVFRVHGKSAWKPGKLDQDKERVLSAIRSGRISVVVVWSVDRWSRGGIADLLDGIRAVKDAGGRIEFVKDEALNVPGPAQELLLAVLGWVAQWESGHRSDRTKNGMERERANGKVMGGSVALGYRLRNGVKVRDEAALKIVHEVFERSARGESTSVIGDWLRRSGYQRRDNTIGDILRNTDYVADDVVTQALATAAVEGLEARRTGCVRRISEEDYSGTVWCRCGTVMHRKMAGGMPAKNVDATRYYRCSDHGSKPVPMVRADDADALIGHVLGNDWLPWLIPVRTGGDTREADKAKLMKRLPRARTRAETNAIWDAIEAVEKQEPTPETIKWVPSGKTRGDRWLELTIPERRAWLQSEGTRITAWNVKSAATGIVETAADGSTSWSRGKVRMVVLHDPAGDL